MPPSATIPTTTRRLRFEPQNSAGSQWRGCSGVFQPCEGDATEQASSGLSSWTSNIIRPSASPAVNGEDSDASTVAQRPFDAEWLASLMPSGSHVSCRMQQPGEGSIRFFLFACPHMPSEPIAVRCDRIVKALSASDELSHSRSALLQLADCAFVQLRGDDMLRT